jgi:hypothetical protein
MSVAATYSTFFIVVLPFLTYIVSKLRSFVNKRADSLPKNRPTSV